MNKPIRAVSIFCMALFLMLMLNVTYLQFWKASDYNKDPHNARAAEAAFSRERGLILVGRNPIARSEPKDDQYKYLRVYPRPFLYAPVTGYLQLGSQTGIERSQNDILSGEDSRLFVNRLADLLQGETSQGGNVRLTLDPKAQRAAFDKLLETVGPQGEGSVVAIEPSTGRILAMVSLPTYDPNKLASHDSAERTKAYADLEADDRQPLLNRAVQTRLFPGSTFKVVTAAAAIENGLYSVGDRVPSGRAYQLPGTTGDQNVVDNEGRTACDPEEISFATAMEWSCNTAFARMAVALGPEKMRRTAEAFGFNSDYLEDLPGQAQSVYPKETTDIVGGKKQAPRELNDAETARTGFGQFDVQATPLQMAMVVAAIANNGKLMRPHIVDELQTADYKSISQTEPEEIRAAISPATASQVTELMVDTVANGTALQAGIPGIDVAGKTGTAQRGIPGKPPYAWFVSFAPAENPDVAVAVMIQEAPGKTIAGGALGGPIAKAVMEAVMEQ